MKDTLSDVCLLTAENSHLHKKVLKVEGLSFSLVTKDTVREHDFGNTSVIISDFDTLRLLREPIAALHNLAYISIIMFIPSQDIVKISELNLRIKEIIFSETPLNKMKTILLNSVKAFNTQYNQIENKIMDWEKQNKNLKALTKIGLSLYEIKDLNELLDLMLTKIREISNADAGSIFLLEKMSENRNGKSTTNRNDVLRFVHAQNYSFHLDNPTFTIPVTKNSIVGYCALTGKIANIPDVNKIDDSYDFRYDAESTGKLRAINKSMLTIPMKNQKNEVVGVIQIFNKKKDFYQKISDPEIFEKQVIPFDKEDEELVISLAGQAAVSLENNILYKEIKSIFEGFIKASIVAIESRDPATSGHSERVSKLSKEFAIQLNNVNEGRYADVFFSDDEIQAIEYAALLHDFGKIGVRERVLSKEKKLYPEEIDILNTRYKYLKKAISNDFMKKKLELREKIDDKAQFIEMEKKLDKKLDRKFREIDNILDVILEVNEPTILKDEKGEILKKLVDKVYESLDGERIPYLTETEAKSLLVKKGNLTDDERFEIEGHVTHSYHFLSIIPWSKEMKSIPNVVYMHHEQLNGGGYPNKLNDDFIPVQSRIISIADVYDALVSQDRPYKKPLPREKALDILKNDAKFGKFDADLVEIFEKYRVYEAIKS